MSGFWGEDGAEAMIGVLATEPMDFCRISAAVHYTPGEPLKVGRVTEPDDPRDDNGVIERHFEQPLDQILAAIFGQLHDAFAAAAELREESGGRNAGSRNTGAGVGALTPALELVRGASCVRGVTPFLAHKCPLLLLHTGKEIFMHRALPE